MITPRDYAQEHAEAFNQQLFEFIRIPSVSTEPERKGDVRQAAEWVASAMRRVGAQNVEVMETAGHPVVYGDWLGAGADAPTVLVYGHYDVQPASMSDGWTSEPFEPVVRDGLVYARGASDDKGQMFIHIKVLESFLATEGKAPVNLKFMFEGEEEIGSLNLGKFIQANKARFAADICVISDGGIQDENTPSICYAVRGMTYMQLDVWGPSQDLHSGGYGGMVHNPALALAQIISKLHDAENHIAVPGFYDDVVLLKDEERKELAKLDMTESKLKQESGVPSGWGEAGFSLLERNVARPTMEINGLLSGWTGEGAKTVLPAKAMAKISCRLVANQNPQRIYELVKAYIASITPPTVFSDVKLITGAFPAMVDIDTPAMQAAGRAYAQDWGAAPVFVRAGGTLPVVADLKGELDLSSILMNYGLPNDGAHGPDERFSLDLFHKGIKTAIGFLEELAKAK